MGAFAADKAADFTADFESSFAETDALGGVVSAVSYEVTDVILLEDGVSRLLLEGTTDAFLILG